MLTFGLKKIWFEKFLSGEKTHEYREVKPYWGKRLMKYIMLSKEDIKHVDFFLKGLKLKLAFVNLNIPCKLKLAFVNLNIPCKLTLGQAPSKKDKSKRIFARIKSIRIINGLDSDLKIDKSVYDIELKLIGVNRGKN